MELCLLLIMKSLCHVLTNKQRIFPISNTDNQVHWHYVTCMYIHIYKWIGICKTTFFIALNENVFSNKYSVTLVNQNWINHLVFLHDVVWYKEYVLALVLETVEPCHQVLHTGKLTKLEEIILYRKTTLLPAFCDYMYLHISNHKMKTEIQRGLKTSWSAECICL